jgi:hypothetical protein
MTTDKPKAPTCDGWPPCGDRNCERCDAMYRETYGTAETDERAAERELGAWLVAHPGWTHGEGYQLWAGRGAPQTQRYLLVQTDAERDEDGERRYPFHEGFGPTKAAAIRAALAKAKGGEGG